MTDRTPNPHTVANDAYDANIIPAETAARAEREGADYKHTPKSDADSIDSTAGYAVDSEGLVNNYAVEPEMYYEVPGDVQQQSAGYVATHDAQSQLDADAAAHETGVAESFVSDDTAELTTDI